MCAYTYTSSDITYILGLWMAALSLPYALHILEEDTQQQTLQLSHEVVCVTDAVFYCL